MRSRLLQREVLQLLNGARRAGAREVQFRIGELSVVVPLRMNDDDDVEANVKEQTAEPERRVSV
jgi:hypothetical protein